jgi:enoyl-CoA hydratase
VNLRTLTLERRGAVAELRLGRPERGSPIDLALLDELDALTADLDADPGVRALLITSAREIFSHGWDMAEPPATATTSGRLAFRCLEEMGIPAVACIEGDAVGAGLELALACDVRIAGEGATFAVPDVAMGTMPTAGATQRLPRLVGRAKAAEMLLLGARLDASDALACGLVNRVVPPGATVAAAEEFAARVAARGPLAVRYAKEAMLRGLDMPLEQALRYETDLTVILQTTEDRAEGVRAFLEKRPPEFGGR